MTNTTRTTTDSNAFRSARTAEARDLRRILALSIVAATAFAAATLIGMSAPSAMQINAEADEPQMLAYAEPLPERFGIFDNIKPTFNDHELNDAWMGMTVVSVDGIVLGYVTDAFVNPDGSIDEIVIAPSGVDGAPATPVFLEADFAELAGDTVQVSLTARAVAGLEPATDLAFAGE